METAFQGFRMASRAPRDAPHRRATRSWPKALERRLYESLSSLLGIMPALSPTMTEGKLAAWLKKEGERVSSGEVIAEIETDKATMEIEAVEEGVLARILVEAGTEGGAVYKPIVLLLEERAGSRTPWPCCCDVNAFGAGGIRRARAGFCDHISYRLSTPH